MSSVSSVAGSWLAGFGPTMSADAALALHIVLSAVTVALIIAIAALVRERRSDRVPDIVYESGVTPSPAPRGPLEVPYFLVAALFVLVDMEAAILFAWAVAAREAGGLGLAVAAVFIGVLLAALAWLWADGALDWVRKPTDFGR